MSSHELLKNGGYLYLNVAEGGHVKGSPGHKPQQIHRERHLPQHAAHGLPPTPRNLLLPSLGTARNSWELPHVLLSPIPDI